MWGVIFPWVIALPLLWQPAALAQFINFSSLIFVSFTDFIVPFCLYVTHQKRQAENNLDPVANAAYTNVDGGDTL